MELINLTRSVSPIHIMSCDTFFSKLRGLMFQKSLDLNTGLALKAEPPGRLNASIHMFFMNFDIAVVWIDSSHKVVDGKLAKKWHPYYAPSGAASYTLELHPSRLSDFKINDQVQFVNT